MNQENQPHGDPTQDDQIIADMEAQFQTPDTSKRIVDHDKAEAVAYAAYEPELEVLAAKQIVAKKIQNLGKKDGFFTKSRTMQVDEALHDQQEARRKADRIADEAARAYDKTNNQ